MAKKRRFMKKARKNREREEEELQGDCGRNGTN